jgi:hypothetical protein
MDPSQWNERYATAEYVWKADPNIFLVAETEGLAPVAYKFVSEGGLEPPRPCGH